MGLANRDLALTHHKARDHAHELVGIFRSLAPARRAGLHARRRARAQRAPALGGGPRARGPAHRLRGPAGSPPGARESRADAAEAVPRRGGAAAQPSVRGRRGSEASAARQRLDGRPAATPRARGPRRRARGRPAAPGDRTVMDGAAVVDPGARVDPSAELGSLCLSTRRRRRRRLRRSGWRRAREGADPRGTFAGGPRRRRRGDDPRGGLRRRLRRRSGRGCRVGAGAVIGDHVLLRERAQVGAESVVGHGGAVGAGVVIGRRARIQNNVVLAPGTVVEDDVFCGPNVTTTDNPLTGTTGARAARDAARPRLPDRRRGHRAPGRRRRRGRGRRRGLRRHAARPGAHGESRVPGARRARAVDAAEPASRPRRAVKPTATLPRRSAGADAQLRQRVLHERRARVRTGHALEAEAPVERVASSRRPGRRRSRPIRSGSSRWRCRGLPSGAPGTLQPPSPSSNEVAVVTAPSAVSFASSTNTPRPWTPTSLM